jgi:hypothetical protein
MTPNEIEEAKKNALALYEAGNLDAANEILFRIPREIRCTDAEIRTLLRQMRYDDEAAGIVSNVSPETRKYFADLLELINSRKNDGRSGQ